MNVFFSVGEPSGDRHAAELIAELRRREPGLTCRGFGGPLMEQAGCRLTYPLTNLAVMGLVELLPMLRQFRQLVRQAEQSFRDDPPDAVILVDFPGFNWWIARAAKRAGIRVFYYLPPQLWAWAPWRVRKMRKYVDHVLSVLAFERHWYGQRGIDVDYVGHPFFDEVATAQLDDQFVARKLSRPSPQVALLPGSRRQEIVLNWPVICEVARQLHALCPNVEFLVACYRESQAEHCREQLAGADASLPLEFHVNKTSEIVEAATCSLMVSGSTSLEMLARTTPAVVLYRCSRSFYYAAKLLVKCKYASLPNLMADQEIMPEFCGTGSAANDIASMTSILHSWLTEPTERQLVIDKLTTLRDEVFQLGATHRAASAVLQRLTSNSATTRAA